LLARYVLAGTAPDCLSDLCLSNARSAAKRI